jgi:hypothetical protein
MVTLGCFISCQCGYFGNGECTSGVCVCDPGWAADAFCDTCADGYVGPNCDIVDYPSCTVPFPTSIGNGFCDGEPYNTAECGYDGGDCCPPGFFGFPICDVFLPNCTVEYPSYIGDGFCDGGEYNTEECGYDGGDCCPPGLFGRNCELNFTNCNVDVPQAVGNCLCNGKPYNTEECGYDGGDCCPPGFVGPNCDIVDYPNCTVDVPNWIGDGWCDWDLDGDYNTENCGWDGGDCCKETCDCSVNPCGINDYFCLDPDYSQATTLSLITPIPNPMTKLSRLEMPTKVTISSLETPTNATTLDTPLTRMKKLTADPSLIESFFK